MTKEGQGSIMGCTHEEEKIIPDNEGRYKKMCCKCGRSRYLTRKEIDIWGEA